MASPLELVFGSCHGVPGCPRAYPGDVCVWGEKQQEPALLGTGGLSSRCVCINYVLFVHVKDC